MALMTVTISGKPGIAAAAKALGVAKSAIDTAYGVVPIDADQNLYAVQVREDSLPKPAGSGSYKGPFDNPRIDPFGPRRK